MKLHTHRFAPPHLDQRLFVYLFIDGIPTSPALIVTGSRPDISWHLHAFDVVHRLQTAPLLIADPAARPLNRMPNSIDTLEPDDWFVEAVNKLPIAHGIPFHSIMGDRGRGDTANSSDGVVPYWSSHLKGAKSELIVNSDHGAQYNPQAIEEVARILRANLPASR